MKEVTILQEEYNILIKALNKLKELEDIVTGGMEKSNEESNLCTIGEKVVSYLGYWE